MVTLGGVKTRLTVGEGNRKLAEDRFHELCLRRSRVPESSSARVADVIEAFLAWSKVHRSDETSCDYFWLLPVAEKTGGSVSERPTRPVRI